MTTRTLFIICFALALCLSAAFVPERVVSPPLIVDNVEDCEEPEPVLLASTSLIIKDKKPKRVKRPAHVAAYIDRFHKVAQMEQRKYGIPASIKLAQAILESRSGTSHLAQTANNHFGIKCFRKGCPKGCCTNREDDHHKDFFRNYDTAWESWRSHSQLLTGKNYRHLLKHGTDYKAWAHGLKEVGYATDERYAYRLIDLIEKYGLNEYDL